MNSTSAAHFQVREVKVMLETNGAKEKGNVRNSNLTNGGIPIGKLIITKGKRGAMSIRAIVEIELTMFYLQEIQMSPSDLDWEDFGNYGADSEAGEYLQNNEETQVYEELRNQSGVEVFRVFANDRILLDRRRKIPRTFKQLKSKISGGRKSRDGFKKTKANIEQEGGRKQSFGEKQVPLAKVEEINLTCDFEHRRSWWGASGNKAACFEFGNTDHFKDQCPIWVKKKRKWVGERPTTKAKGKPKGQKGKGKRAIGPLCLSGRRIIGPWK